MKFKQLLPSLLAAATALAAIFAPQVQSAIASHPTVSAVCASLYAIFAHFLPSPASQS